VCKDDSHDAVLMRGKREKKSISETGRHKELRIAINSENVRKQSMLFSLRTSEIIVFCSLHATGYLRPRI
jgi:hypothetical protein